MNNPIANVNVTNVKHNISEVRKLIPENVKLYAVVKSNAYGHGLCGLSTRIEKFVDGFCVARVDEGVALRYVGIDKPVIVLMPIRREETSLAVRFNLIFPVENVLQLTYTAKIAKDLGCQASVNIAINSGMNRFGLSEMSDYSDMLSFSMSNTKTIKINGIYSHFADFSDKKYSEFQYEIFSEYDYKIKKFLPDTVSHLSASGGLLVDSKYCFDAVRVGIILYGYSPIDGYDIDLRPSLTVTADVVEVRNMMKGERLLYGDYVLSNDEKVNILAYGYADGLFRKGFDGSLNNLCMDACATNNGNVVLHNAKLIAEKNDTIPYEVLVNATKRCEFIYTDD